MFHASEERLDMDDVNLNVSSPAEGEDYNGTEFVVSFRAGQNRKAFTIPILDDSAFEPHEIFSLTLEIPQAAMDYNVLRGDPFTSSVIIKDDDSECLMYYSLLLKHALNKHLQAARCSSVVHMLLKYVIAKISFH